MGFIQKQKARTPTIKQIFPDFKTGTVVMGLKSGQEGSGKLLLLP
jgi:hypothetical protein